MKSYKYIIAALFVVAIGVGVFMSCEKDNNMSANNATNTHTEVKKEQKVDNLPGQWYTIDYYEFNFDGKCYHVTGEYCMDEDGYIWSSSLTYTQVNCEDIAIPAETPPFNVELTPNDEYSIGYDSTDITNYDVVVEGEALPTNLLNGLIINTLIYICS